MAVRIRRSVLASGSYWAHPHWARQGVPRGPAVAVHFRHSCRQNAAYDDVTTAVKTSSRPPLHANKGTETRNEGMARAPSVRERFELWMTAAVDRISSPDQEIRHNEEIAAPGDESEAPARRLLAARAAGNNSALLATRQ